jgi:PAS domain S-box-containing protein
MDASRDGIALVSAQGTLLYANAAAITLLAMPGPEAVIGQHWLDLLRSTDPPETIRAIAAAVAADGAWHGQIQLIRHDGAPIDVELSTTRNTDGGALCILRDISNKLRAQAEPATSSVVGQAAAAAAA